MMNNKAIKRAAKPENAGIDSSVINKMIEEFNEFGVGVHSLMILRHGQVAVESYSAPLTADTPHMVYSVSKSFLATAYGFALNEGLISRDTRVLEIIPELRQKKRDDKLEKLTVHHLLTMTAGKQSSVKGMKNKDILQAFASAKWLFEPGEGWRYVNDNYYVAAVMLTRVTGQSVTEYLTPRLYEPLGIKIPFWEKSSCGIESGGWGLILKTEDIAKFILCCHNKGVYDGVQVIPAEWVSEATSFLADNSQAENCRDSQAGYGCGFWRCAGMPDTFRCEGMYCQYAISIEKYDACFVMTSDHSDLQETLDIVWKYLESAFIEKCDIESVPIKLPDKSVVPKTQRNKETERNINGKLLEFRRCKFSNVIGFPVSVFPMPVVFFDHNPCGNINSVKFEFLHDCCEFSWEEDGGNKNTLCIGMDGNARYGEVKIGQMQLAVRAYAYWEDDALTLNIRALPSVAERIMRFEFRGNRVRMVPSSKPGTDDKAEKIGNKLKCVLKGKWFWWWIDFLVPRVGRILNPVHHGKIK